jgi:hypothetical protein
MPEHEDETWAVYGIPVFITKQVDPGDADFLDDLRADRGARGSLANQRGEGDGSRNIVTETSTRRRRRISMPDVPHMPEVPDLAAVQAAVARCGARGRCDCGKAAGHAGWLACIQRIVQETKEDLHA